MNTSRLHEIRCGNPATSEEISEMAKIIINHRNAKSRIVGYKVQQSDGHTYMTDKVSVALWARQKGHVVSELTEI